MVMHCCPASGACVKCLEYDLQNQEKLVEKFRALARDLAAVAYNGGAATKGVIHALYDQNGLCVPKEWEDG